MNTARKYIKHKHRASTKEWELDVYGIRIIRSNGISYCCSYYNPSPQFKGRLIVDHYDTGREIV